jgi:FkbM family methyltransferase
MTKLNVKRFSELAPIVLFVYNRPWHTRQTLDSLLSNELANESEFFIYADGPKEDATEDVKEKIKDVRKLIQEKKWCKKNHITESDKNKGLAASIIEGVTEIVNHYGKIIVLEDDLLLSENFLKFMNLSLETYKNDKRIFSISGYRYPGIIPDNYREQVFLFPRASSWGWGTWKDRWNLADWQLKNFDNFLADTNSQERFNAGGRDLTNMLIMQVQDKIDSWAIRWCYAHHVSNAYGLFPVKSKIQNIGLDGSGIHCKPSSKFFGKIEDVSEDIKLPKGIKINEEIIKNHAAFFKENYTQQDNVKKNIFSLRIGDIKQIIRHMIRKTGYDVVRYNPATQVSKDNFQQRLSKDVELDRLKNFPRYKETQTNLFGEDFKIVDALSFYHSYKEIFEQEIYRFHAESDSPFIIDGGSNIGTSILFFKINYLNSKIIGFEADPKVFKILQENITNFKLSNVILYNNALWDTEGTISFMSEGADGGRILSHLNDFNKIKVRTVRLGDFLKESVDFLKLDIEGAEVDVLIDSANKLDKVKNIFIEYHSFQDQVQRLDELLGVLRKTGFRYQIHTQFASQNPLLSRTNQLGMDLQLNIFGYRV